MATFASVSIDVLTKPASVKSGRTISPEMQEIIDMISTIVDDTVVYEVSFDEGVKPLTFRQSLLRAAKHANVNIIVRKASDTSFYIALLTDARKSNRGRKSAVVEAAAE